jgi:uroporphyrinogen decarboxylase
MDDTKNETAEKLLLRALAGERTNRPPFWLMRQAGRYLPEYRALRREAENFLEFCYTPDLAVEATLQPIRRFHPDAAILFSDILVIPHALGQVVRFVENEGPKLDPVRSVSDLDALECGRVADVLAPVYETVRRVRSALPEDVTLIGFAGAPWTVATYMVEGGSSKDFATVKGWAFGAPGDFQRLIDRIVDVTIAHLGNQVDAGAQALQLFDSWAGVLPESFYRRWVVEPTKTIVSALHERHPGVPIIGFPRGSGLLYETFAAEVEGVAIGLDSTVPLEWARDRLQPHRVVQGNLDSSVLVVGGAVMEMEASRILRIFGDGPFIFNLGHGVIPRTPPENVEALASLIRNWRL